MFGWYCKQKLKEKEKGEKKMSDGRAFETWTYYIFFLAIFPRFLSHFVFSHGVHSTYSAGTGGACSAGALPGRAVGGARCARLA